MCFELEESSKASNELEQLDEVASLMSDPPSASPTVYMDLFLKFQDLAAENSGLPVGAYARKLAGSHWRPMAVRRTPNLFGANVE